MREMKDSGIEWIGAIPTTWHTQKMKYISNFIQNKYSSDYGLLPYIGLENIASWSGSFISTNSQYDREQSLICEPEDILFGKLRPYLAKVYMNDRLCCCSNEFAVIRVNGQNKRYMWYQLLSHGFIFEIDRSTYGTKMPRANAEFIRNVFVALPSEIEQQKIANYLDKMCAEIDAVLEKTRASIEEYKKLKQAIITQAVTKGIRGDRPMKDSGIEWIGDIPAEWRKTQLRHCAAIKSGITLGKKYEKTDNLVERPYLRVANVQDGYVDLSVLTTIEVTQDEDLKYRLRAGDVLMTEGGDRDKLGRGCVWHGEIEPCLHQNHIFAVQTSKETLLPEFLEYLTVSDVGRSYFDVTAIKTTNLACTSSSKVLAFTIPLPSVEEQAEIVEALNTKCAGIDALVAKKQQYLTEIENYKKSLIYEYVTGKKEVV